MSHLLFEESSSNPMKANELLQGLTNAARDNPLPAAILGVGLLWVLGRDIAVRIGDSRKASHANKTEPRPFSPSSDEIDSTQYSIGQKVVQGMRNAENGFTDILEEQPLVVGAVGLAIGAGLAALFPATAIESDILGPQAKNLAERAKRLVAGEAS